MASITHSNDRNGSRSLGDLARTIGLRVQAYRAAAEERRRITRELSQYSDDELGELGFSRSDIPAVAAGTFRR